MSKYLLKLGATMTLNQEQEADIIKQLEDLKSRHKLGEFIGYALRLTFDHPELLEEQRVSLEKFGLTDNRVKFFNEARQAIMELMDKTNKIYSLTTEMYSLTLFNKKLGLEDRAKNILSAQFILQKQTRDLCRVLGISQINSTYASERIFDINKNVDETLEFIIKYYDGIVNEIKATAVGMDGQEKKIAELSKMIKDIEDSKYIKDKQQIKGDAEDTKDDKPIIDEETEIEGFELAHNADLSGMADFLGI